MKEATLLRSCSKLAPERSESGSKQVCGYASTHVGKQCAKCEVRSAK